MNTIILKHRVTGAANPPSSLSGGEVAFNEVNSILWYGAGNNGFGNATNIIPIGGSGYYMDLFSSQAVTGIKSFASLPTVPLTPINPGDVASKSYVDTALINSSVASFNGRTGAVSLIAADIPSFSASKISDLAATVQGYRLDQFAAPTVSVSFNGQQLTNIATPLTGTDAANKAYVDAAVQGLSIKNSVLVSSNTNVSLSSPGTVIDGVTLLAGSRVLLLNQTTASQNGIYVWNGATTTMARSSDAATSAQLLGAFVFVEQGSAADAGFTMTTDSPITLETTSLSWTQFSGAGQIVNGFGITKVGNTLSVSTTYPGQASITTVGTIMTGVWQGTAVGIQYGGTGASTPSQARINLGLDTMATQNAGAVAITGGTINGIIIDGGTF